MLSRLFKIKSTLIVVIAAALAGCAGVPPNLQVPDLMPAKPLVQNPDVVLVLGSGGARGYAHLGVIQALTSAHIPINAMTCASAGCIVGALFADNDSAKKTYNIMMHAGFWDFADISNLPNPKGLMEGYHLEKFLTTHMKAKYFRQLKIPLMTSTTNLLTGKPFVIHSGPVAPAVLASAAIPGVVQPVHLYGRTLVDGGVASPVPARYTKRLHPKVVIAINIAQQLSPHLPSTSYSTYSRAYDIMWQRLTMHSETGANIVIRPRVGHVGTFDLDQRYQLYLKGLAAGNKMVPKILALLKKKGIPLTK